MCHSLLLVAPCTVTQSLSWSQELSRSPRLWYGTMCCHHHVYAFTTGCCLAGMLLILQLNVLLIITCRSILLQNTNVRTQTINKCNAISRRQHLFSLDFSLFPALLLLFTRYSVFHLYSHALSSLSSVFSPSKMTILYEILP